MTIYAISDLHFSTACDKPMDIFGGNWMGYEQKVEANWKKLVKPTDIVLIAGDISWAMKLDEAVPDLNKIGAWKGKKIVIKGNHEYWWKSISAVRNVLPENMFALQNDSIKIKNTIFCGTRGWTVTERGKKLPEDEQKIFNREVERLKLTLKDMQKNRSPKDKVICMMHYPPLNSTRDESEFSKLLEEYDVNAVVYGHIHGKASRKEPEFEKNGIRYYLTSCDQINNMPVKIKI